jgi:uncharacterized oxidoreductase
MALQGTHAAVTGGGSGIGLAITRALREAGAIVTIIGRSQDRLDAAAGADPGISTIAADVSTPEGRDQLVAALLGYPVPLDVLVNNAGTMTAIDLHEVDALRTFDAEIALDLTAPVHLTTALLPHLLSRPQAAVVNVTTGLVHTPFAYIPAYSTAKAGLRAFTQAVRWQTRASRLQVLEVQPPTVDTTLVKGYNGPKVQPDVVARAVLKALRSGRSELAVGQAKALSILARIAPVTAYRLMNTTVEKSLPATPAPASAVRAQHRP